ncbi:hypothetical protein FHU33_1522 [Blastococcus colisei]|uniref:Uncharacterized protein n=1 Tax=Blastococcus colisei TaxID=1564162 RepID=A0A543PDG7_9ACTN|nr:hypothetical protein [Blastococcus colisei]TQN42128.1 hypothetical protein FHU33_1522 [Blastococcus colisei]
MEVGCRYPFRQQLSEASFQDDSCGVAQEGSFEVSSVDRLWESARTLPWNHRPDRQDIATIISAIRPSDRIIGVHRVAWSLTSAGVLVVTNRALLVGDDHSGHQWNWALAAAPPAFRVGSKALAIPRTSIRRIELTASGIAIFTDSGPVDLPARAGPNRHEKLEWMLRLIDPGNAAPLGGLPPEAETVVEEDTPYPGLWSGRERIDGLIVVTRARPDDDAGSDLVSSAGRAWRRLPRWTQWVVSIAIFLGLQTFAAPGGVAYVVLMVLFLGWTDPEKSAERRAAARRRPRAGSPEAVLAASGSIEARVAGAAYRAWEETVREPSWSSPAMAGTRESFDGQREVDTIVDLAIRIHAARDELGIQPDGSLADYWRQQMDALDRAALRLGDRADALIRHRDQAAELSAELGQLAELERLERSALVVDDLTLATAAAPGRDGQTPVSEQITAARQTVGELIDLMTRTRAPLAEPAQPPTP